MSYNDDIVPPELLYETDKVRSMTYPCSDFLTASGIKVEFDNLSAAASLTRLVTHQAPQYPKLTYYFVNWFRFNDKTSMIEFRLYDEVLTMSLAKFCDVIGVRNVGKMSKIKIQPTTSKAL